MRSDSSESVLVELPHGGMERDGGEKGAGTEGRERTIPGHEHCVGRPSSLVQTHHARFVCLVHMRCALSLFAMSVIVPRALHSDLHVRCPVADDTQKQRPLTSTNVAPFVSVHGVSGVSE